METSRKLRLELDDVRVESFRTAPDGKDDRGTVHGHDGPGSGVDTCPCTSYGEEYPYNTCAVSCFVVDGEVMVFPC
jgi:hypothetical protein